MKMKEAMEILAPMDFGAFNRLLMGEELSEADVLELFELEKKRGIKWAIGKHPRKSVLQRLHTRYAALRHQREVQEGLYSHPHTPEQRARSLKERKKLSKFVGRYCK